MKLHAQRRTQRLIIVAKFKKIAAFWLGIDKRNIHFTDGFSRYHQNMKCSRGHYDFSNTSVIFSDTYSKLPILWQSSILPLLYIIVFFSTSNFDRTSITSNFGRFAFKKRKKQNCQNVAKTEEVEKYLVRNICPTLSEMPTLLT